MGMVVIVSILLLAFFTAVRFDLLATTSYGQSLKAEQLGIGALRVVVSQYQQEMGKDALPDMGGSLGTNTVYTNFSATDVIPQGVGTNSAMPDLIQISTNSYFYTGTLTRGTLKATDINTATPSVNGRFVSPTRWGHAYMGDFPNSSTTPYWVLMARSGPSDGTGATYGQHNCEYRQQPGAFQ
ncbi:MAG: hypothetical protein WDO13_12100 [Verrucomicrobiota bacterium]